MPGNSIERIEGGDMRLLVVFLTGAMFILLGGCGEGSVETSAETLSPASATVTTAATTTAQGGANPKSGTPFAASVHDVITQLNLQLPILVDAEVSTKLPVAVLHDGVFGGPVTRSAEIYLQSSANAFSPLRAVTVRVTGASGSVQTPARLLSGVGVSLYALSAEVADAFRKDALPRLSTITQTRTTITVGTFYDLTVVVLSQSELAFIFTPIGVSPPPGVENLGP
jgi:hypothetical protein